VPGQFHGDQPPVTAVGERPQHRRKVDLAGAELQVLVHAPAHVVDLHVDQELGDVGDAVRHAHRLEAAAVSDVERQPERGRLTQLGPQPPPPGDILDQHARLRFEAQRHTRGRCHTGDLGDAVDKPPPRHVRIDVRRPHPGPAGDRLGAQVGADSHGPAQKLQALFPVVVQERRRVLAPRVEQVSRAGLDHHREVEPAQQIGGAGNLPGGVRRERVQVVMIQRERHAGVAELGDHRERVGQPVVGEAVGAVAEAQPAHVADTFRTRAAATGAASATRAPGAAAPARAASAPCRAGNAVMPAPTALRTVGAAGSVRTAAWARP
jgi:hypothetical protein